MLLINADVYRTETRSFEKTNIKINNGIITDIGHITDDESIIDLEGCAIVPGLIDVHTHGRAGYDFATAPAEALPLMARDYARHGVTTVMPTVASAPFEDMLEATRRINAFVQQEGEANFCGVHLEGRYLSLKYKGAHAEKYISELNADELDNEVFRMCRRLQISAAYERDTDGSFADAARRIGATMSLGHTAATYAEARAAEKCGVIAYTHLFNAMSPLHHRDGGAPCAALTGNCFAELICDGIHIAPQMIQMAYLLLGRERAVLISDSMEATGCSDGEYSIAGEPVTVKNGRAHTHSGAIAGSTLTLDEAVRNLMDYCSIPLGEAILGATKAPAQQVGIFDECGSLDVGKRADMLILDNKDRLDILKIMVNGEFI